MCNKCLNEWMAIYNIYKYIIYNKLGTSTFLYMAHLKGYLKELDSVIIKTSRQNSLARWQANDQWRCMLCSREVFPSYLRSWPCVLFRPPAD